MNNACVAWEYCEYIEIMIFRLGIVKLLKDSSYLI